MQSARIAISILLLICTQTIAASLQAPPNTTSDSQPASHPRIRVSRETSWLLEPVAPDGYVDYVAAFDARMRRGVTPENNAGVLLWQAVIPEIPETDLKNFYEKLGTNPPASAAPTFIPLTRFHQRVDEEEQERAGQQATSNLARAATSPWTTKDFPEIRAWLDRNQRPLQIVTEASRRPAYYLPQVSGDVTEGRLLLLSVRIPDCQTIRELQQALLARAMLHLGEGRLDDAHADVMTCHRWARLLANHETAIARSVAAVVDSLAFRADATIAHHGRLTAEQSARFREELEGLEPLPKVTASLDTSARCMTLDAMTLVARNGADAFPALSALEETAKATVVQSIWDLVDWNIALKTANEWYDRAVALMALPDRVDRDFAIAEFGEELRAIKTAGFDKPDDADLREWMSVRMGELCVCLLFPSLDFSLKVDEQTSVWRDLVLMTHHLADFRRAENRYPERLTELTPAHMQKLPDDPFAHQPYIYRSIGTGYILYSVGRNGIDENSATFDTIPAGDDLRLYFQKAVATPVGSNSNLGNPTTEPPKPAEELPHDSSIRENSPVAGPTRSLRKWTAALTVVLTIIIAGGTVAWLVRRR